MSNVTIYCPSLRGGGAERVMVAVANGLVKTGHHVDLVLAQSDGVYHKVLHRKVNLVNLGVRRVSRSIVPFARYLRERRPVAVLTALAHANVAAVVARRVSQCDARLVLSEHNVPSISRRQSKLIRGRVIHHFMRLAYPQADAVIAVSQAVADDLRASIGLAGTPIHIVHNPVLSPDLIAQSFEKLPHPWFQRGAPPVILGVGRLTHAKDFATLIRAFARIRHQREARLMILGEGELRRELEDLVRQLGIFQDVALPGFVDNPFSYMRRSSVFVMSSAWEGFGNALVEAMACGTRVVSTDCPGGPREILQGERWGRLVTVGDSEALAAAISEVLTAEGGPPVARRAADFSVERAVEEYARVLGL